MRGVDVAIGESARRPAVFDFDIAMDARGQCRSPGGRRQQLLPRVVGRYRQCHQAQRHQRLSDTAGGTLVDLKDLSKVCHRHRPGGLSGDDRFEGITLADCDAVSADLVAAAELMMSHVALHQLR